MMTSVPKKNLEELIRYISPRERLDYINWSRENVLNPKLPETLSQHIFGDILELYHYLTGAKRFDLPEDFKVHMMATLDLNETDIRKLLQSYNEMKEESRKENDVQTVMP